MSGVVGLGIPLLKANFPRAFLDVNREPYELDQAMFGDELPTFVNSKSVRVSSGLGTIARIVSEGQEIYKRRLTADEAIKRIETLYKPYHAELRNLIAKTHVVFGCAVLVDCHSMPSSNPVYQNETRPDFVLGDRFGSSCHPALTNLARDILTAKGYKVTLNKPYAGGFITEHYGRPENGLHALQIEMNRGLYMNETVLRQSPEFESLQMMLTDFYDQLTQVNLADLSGTVPLAAE
ncbi:MAG: N-formylglutamate amidohydrolase [Pseudomonadota bacterium]